MAEVTILDATRDIEQDDIIIAFMGPTGVGKSYFIDLLTNQMGMRSGRSLRSVTTNVQATRVRHPTSGTTNIVLVETPGFDDTTRTDFEILMMMSDWVEKTYKRDIKLTGILYLHRITDNRMAGAPLKNLRVFRNICGDSAMARVVIVSTMWERVRQEVGEQRESVLEQQFWKPLIENGASVDRLWKSNCEEAWRIVDHLIRSHKNRQALLLQQEMVDLGRKLNETTAGQILYGSLKKLLADQKDSLKSLFVQVERAGDPRLKRELEKEYKKIQEQYQRTSNEVNKMKVPLSRRIQIFLSRGPWHQIDNRKKTGETVMVEKMETESERGRERHDRRRKEDGVRHLTEEQEKEKEKEREIERGRERWREIEQQERKQMDDEVRQLTREQRNEQDESNRNSSDQPSEQRSLTADSLLNTHDPLPSSALTFVSQLVALKAAYFSSSSLQNTELQLMVDFLNNVLDNQDVLAPNLRKQTLLLLSKLTKSTQIFPRCFELTGVECNLKEAPFIQGGFGCIYKGHFESQMICVKAVRVIQHQATNPKAIRAQAGELIFCAHLSHDNVLPFYGVYFSVEEAPRICLVSPWMEHGDLSHYLKKYPKRPRTPLLLDVISGLEYLHESDIVHCDLKATNVLVSSTERAMLTDFGISRFLTTTGVTQTTAAPGTTYWMAPELLTAEDVLPPTFSSDMWSFGCTCYEVMTGKNPYHRHKIPTHLISAFMRTEGRYTPLQADPEKKHDEHEGALEVWRLAEQCWDPNPEGRPTAEKVRQSLAALGVKDDRPSPQADSARFLRVKRARQQLIKIDYNRVHSILKQVQDDTAAKGQSGTGS